MIILALIGIFTIDWKCWVATAYQLYERIYLFIMPYFIYIFYLAWA